MAEGRIISVSDSVKLEPGLAPTMLQGLALPNDMMKVPEELQPSLVHASAYVVQAGQAILRAYNQANLLAAERKRYHADLKVEREKSRSYKGSLQTAKTQIAELEREKEEMAEKLKKAERELGQVVRREKRKMKEVDQKAYQAGYDRAGQEYRRDARSMVNDHLQEKLPIAYKAGYKAGVAAVGEGMQLELDLSRIPAPTVPELELPYTEEECAPLPDEEFSESEEDLEDLTVVDLSGDDNDKKKGDGDEIAADAGKGVEKEKEKVADAGEADNAVAEHAADTTADATALV